MTNTITIAQETATKTYTAGQYQAQAKRQSNKRAKAQAEFEAHMKAQQEALLAQELKARVQETHEPAPQLTFEHAVTQALDKMRTLKGNAWNLAIYPNSTSWCKLQLFGKTKFTCQANQRAVVLISQKRVTEEVLNKYAHKVGKQNQFDFRPETPEELKALLIDLMTCNC